MYSLYCIIGPTCNILYYIVMKVILGPTEASVKDSYEIQKKGQGKKELFLQPGVQYFYFLSIDKHSISECAVAKC